MVVAVILIILRITIVLLLAIIIIITLIIILTIEVIDITLIQSTPNQIESQSNSINSNNLQEHEENSFLNML